MQRSRMLFVGSLVTIVLSSVGAVIGAGAEPLYDLLHRNSSGEPRYCCNPTMFAGGDYPPSCHMEDPLTCNDGRGSHYESASSCDNDCSIYVGYCCGDVAYDPLIPEMRDAGIVSRMACGDTGLQQSVVFVRYAEFRGYENACRQVGWCCGSPQYAGILLTPDELGQCDGDMVVPLLDVTGHTISYADACRSTTPFVGSCETCLNPQLQADPEACEAVINDDRNHLCEYIGDACAPSPLHCTWCYDRAAHSCTPKESEDLSSISCPDGFVSGSACVQWAQLVQGR